MRLLKVKFLYGQDFWNEIQTLASSAKERVFIVSAFQGRNTHDWLKSIINPEVFFLNLCRSDNSEYKDKKKQRYIPESAVKIKSNVFHGKLYLFDNTIILGSQNLYNVALENKSKNGCKEGEFSVLLEMEKPMATLVLYQALLKIIEKEKVQAEPVDKEFLYFYSDGCPFCESIDVPDPQVVHTCPGYSMGDYITDDECDSYGDEGACKYCAPENQSSLGESYCCSSCGIGVVLKKRKLIYHAINPLTEKPESLKQAKEYIRLFNFFNKNTSATEIFQALDFTGKVYMASLERKEFKMVGYDTVIQYLKEKGLRNI